MYKHLLVPVDGTQLADRAVGDSVALALRLGARITALVVEPLAPTLASGYGASSYVRSLEEHDARTEEHARGVLEQFRRRAADEGVVFDGLYTRSPNVDAAIVDTAGERHCDLIVMATHGRSAFGELLFGSHTRNVLTRSALPLLVLH